MIKWQSVLGIVIELDVADKDARSLPVISGQNEQVIKQKIEQAIGPYGHQASKQLTGFELDSILKENFSEYGFTVKQGDRFISQPEDIPENAVS